VEQARPGDNAVLLAGDKELQQTEFAGVAVQDGGSGGIGTAEFLAERLNELPLAGNKSQFLRVYVARLHKCAQPLGRQSVERLRQRSHRVSLLLHSRRLVVSGESF